MSRRELTDDERDAWAEWSQGGTDGQVRCAFCGGDMPIGENEYDPFCSEDCHDEAGAQESYDRVHPRPEEV